ncbi:MAG: D-hexose-6-phosphate mutarotase [Colwellia sp.]
MSVLKKNNFGQVQQVDLANDIKSLTINHMFCQAKVSLYGGHVLSWQPNDQQEVFWLSKSSLYQQGQPIRGGIPLCWPWFGAHHNDVKNESGNHGFARLHNWHVESINIYELGVEIVLLWQGSCTHYLWPTACQLKQTLFFGKVFKQQLEMTNLSDVDAEYTGALHSYFSVSSPEKINIEKLSHASFFDKLTGEHNSAQLLSNGVGPVDRIYDTNDVMEIVDHQWQRTIEVVSEHTNQWVFWNPGQELAEKTADIHPSGENEFVCLEAANAKVQILPALSSITIGQTIRVIPFDGA